MQHWVKVDQKHGAFAALKVSITREKTKSFPVNQLTDLCMVRALVLNGLNFCFFLDIGASFSQKSSNLEEFYVSLKE